VLRTRRHNVRFQNIGTRLCKIVTPVCHPRRWNFGPFEGFSVPAFETTKLSKGPSVPNVPGEAK